MYYSSEREFKLWDYNVSHKQLLLRSPSAPDIDGNIDATFWQVEYVAIPTFISGLSIFDASDIERSCFENTHKIKLQSPLYRFKSGDNNYFIASGGFQILENNRDIFESTLVDFATDRPDGWYGKVVAHSSK